MKIYSWKNLISGVIGLLLAVGVLVGMIISKRVGLLSILIVIGIPIFEIPQIMSAFSKEDNESKTEETIEEKLRKAQLGNRLFNVAMMTNFVIQIIGWISYFVTKEFMIALCLVPLAIQFTIVFLFVVGYSIYTIGKEAKKELDKGKRL